MASLKDVGYNTQGEDMAKASDYIGKNFVITGITEQLTKFGEALLFRVDGPDGPACFFMGQTPGRVKMMQYLLDNPGQTIGPVKLLKEDKYYTFLDVYLQPELPEV